jgi:hypothetical protein
MWADEELVECSGDEDKRLGDEDECSGNKDDLLRSKFDEQRWWREEWRARRSGGRKVVWGWVSRVVEELSEEEGKGTEESEEVTGVMESREAEVGAGEVSFSRSTTLGPSGL